MNIAKNLYKSLQLAKAIRGFHKENTRQKSLQYLSNLFENESGLLLKIGQVLCQNKEFQEIIEVVHKQDPVLSDLEVNSLIFELFPEEDIKYIHFLACASLSQVQLVEWKANKIALKMMLPNIQEEVEKQLKLLNLLPNMGPSKKWGVDLDTYKKLFYDLFSEELNYEHEKEKLKNYQSIFNGFDAIEIPKVYDDLCSTVSLAMEYMEGSDLQLVKSWDLETKTKLAEALVEFLLVSLFHHDQIQSDFNMGNFKFTRKSIQCLDFGSIYSFHSDFKLYLAKMCWMIWNDEHIDPLAIFTGLGFDEKKLSYLHERLPLIIKSVFEPIQSSKKFDLSEWHLDLELERSLGEEKWWFRAAGGKDFFVLMKACKGLFHLIRELDVKINFRQLVEKHSLHLLPVIAGLNIESHSDKNWYFDSLASKLRVSVTENGVEKVSLTLPIYSLRDLSEYMESEILEKLKERNIDINELVSQNIRSGAYPQELFHLMESKKSYRVWTE